MRDNLLRPVLPAGAAARRLARSCLPRWLRNWLRDPRASRRWLRSQWDARRGRVAELDFGEQFGHALQFRCHPESGRTFQLFLREPDSMVELREFRRACTPGMRFLDIGAHYGFFSLAALALGGSTARVLAIEPSPAAFHVLKHNLALMPDCNRARALNAAVAPMDGSLRMLAAGVGSENYMFAAAVDRTDAASVPALSLAGLARQAGWSPTHIKLDVEGFESELFEAAASVVALRAWRAPLFLELHCGWIRDRGRDPAAVLEALRAAGYGPPLWQGAAVEERRILELPVARLACWPD